MYTFITILIVIACILLTLAVLVQNAKGGGLAAGFSGSSQVMGVRKTTDFLEKLTWGLASALLILSLVSNFTLSSGKKAGSSLLKDQIENAPTPVQQNNPAQGGQGRQGGQGGQGGGGGQGQGQQAPAQKPNK